MSPLTQVLNYRSACDYVLIRKMENIIYRRPFSLQVDVTNRSSFVDLSNYVYSGEWDLLHISVQVFAFIHY